MDFRPLVERKPKEILHIQKTMRKALEAGISEKAAARFAGITMEQWDEMCDMNPEMDKLRQDAETIVGTQAVLNVADAIKSGDVRTSRWYLERTTDEFSTKQSVKVGGVPVVVPIEEKEEELAKLMEQFNG